MMDITVHQAAVSEFLLPLATSGIRASGRTVDFEIPVAAIPEAAGLLLDKFRLELSVIVANDVRQSAGQFQLFYLFVHPRENWFVQMAAGVEAGAPHFPSIAALSYPASRYEREIRDQFGLQADGHPDPQPLVRHGFWPENYYPLRKDAMPPDDLVDDGSPFPFRQVEGEGIYEIPVGPVHAGIIEPGHFRFSVDGETIINMRARLYFTHKGIEKLFEGREPAAGVELAERISGDTSVGHGVAYCQALESLAQIEIPDKAKYWRVILLELERMYNHVADFGAIVNDAGFALGHAHALRIREQLLRLNKRLTGHRLLRGVLQPGGVNRDFPSGIGLRAEIEALLHDFEEVFDLCWNANMLRDRLRATGRLARNVAEDHTVLGYVARASGLDRDVRRDHPFAAYGRLRFEVPVLTTGDVEARALIRVEELRQAAALILQALEAMPEGKWAEPLGGMPAWEPAFALVEAWRGETVHWLMLDERGRLYRVKVKDPSFVNWPALSLALLNNIVPDFPLCNKSFNLSYSGNDL